MTLERLLMAYEPSCEQERRDHEEMLRLLRQYPGNIFTRENESAHFTASAWIVNSARDKALMAYHNIYNSWSWTGGHADGETDLLAVALKEVREETGLTNIRAVTEEIYSLEILQVSEHQKRGKTVPAHRHLNLTYLIEADEHEALRIKEDENSGLAWFSQEEAVERSTEPEMQVIYRKLIRKLNK